MLRTLLFAGVLASATFQAGAEQVPFSLRFVAMHGDQAASCTIPIAGLGPAGDMTIGLSDLRFYISDIVFMDADGAEIAAALTPSPFQLVAPEGAVALVDLTGASAGACAPGAISFGEGTERVNATVSGTRAQGTAATVRFRVGVPQDLMRAVIAATSAEDAPSPMGEMYWNWASGYRHFVLNHTVDVADGRFGEGYVHVGSMDCGPAEGKALSDRDTCGLIYTPEVTLPISGETETVIAVDLAPIFAAVDLVAPVYDPETFAVIGERPGTDCHSSNRQPDCAAIFPTLGLDMETGKADATANRVFRLAE
ncbi:MAG: MbnP family copper-binding protein [Pseudomonadota bacterium]